MAVGRRGRASQLASALWASLGEALRSQALHRRPRPEDVRGVWDAALPALANPDEAPGYGEEVPQAIGAQLPPELVRHVLDFAPYRYLVASVRDDGEQVTLWGPKGAHCVLRSEGLVVSGIEFVPPAGQILSWSAFGFAVVWDTFSCVLLHELQFLGAVDCVHVFPAGDRVVVCEKHRGLGIWSIASGQRLSSFAAHDASFAEVFPSGDRVVTWGLGGDLSVWDVAAGKLACRCVGHETNVYVVRVLPGGDRWLSGGQDGRSFIWGSSCEVMQEMRHEVAVVDVAVLADGEHVATVTADGEIDVWSSATGGMLSSMRAYGSLMEIVGVEAFPGGGEVLVAVTTDGAFTVNSTSGETLHSLASAPEWVLDVSIAPGGDMVVTCGNQGLNVWDARSGAKLYGIDHLDDCMLVGVGVGRVLDSSGFGCGAWDELGRLHGAAGA